MRIPALPGGGWAELREHLDYGPAREVRILWLRLTEDAAAMADLDLALVRAYVTAWDVKNTAGDPVPIDAPERAGDQAIQAIALVALDLWKASIGTALGAKVPKAGRRRSPNSPPEQR